jgi:hypothetical protein
MESWISLNTFCFPQILLRHILLWLMLCGCSRHSCPVLIDDQIAVKFLGIQIGRIQILQKKFALFEDYKDRAF